MTLNTGIHCNRKGILLFTLATLVIGCAAVAVIMTYTSSFYSQPVNAVTPSHTRCNPLHTCEYSNHRTCAQAYQVAQRIQTPVNLQELNTTTTATITVPAVPPYYVGVCAMAKSEPIVREFVIRSALAGVSHIWLYDNNEPDDNYFTESLRDLTQYVTVVPWKHNQSSVLVDPFTKLRSHLHCFQQFSHLTKYMTFIDVDEFITLTNPLQRLPDYLKQFEPPFHQNIGAVQLHWKNMYTGRHFTLLKHQTLTEHASEWCSYGVDVKTIFLVEAYKQVAEDTHYVHLKPGWRTVNEHGHDANLFFDPDAHATGDHIFLAHYYAKGSVVGYFIKSLRGQTGVSNNHYDVAKLRKAVDCQPKVCEASVRLAALVNHAVFSLKPMPRFVPYRGRSEFAHQPLFQLLLQKYDNFFTFDEQSYIKQYPEALSAPSPLAHFILNYEGPEAPNQGAWKTRHIDHKI